MSPKSAILTLNGSWQDEKILRCLIQKGYFHLCADGAYDLLQGMDITPDAVIGDMDSIKKLPDNCRVIPMPNQEQNDSEKALEWLIQEGYSTVHIHGFRGDRLDHELVNLNLFLRVSSHLDIFAYEGGQLARILRPGVYTFRGCKGDLLSLIPLSPVEDIHLEGTEYTLESETLFPGSRGLSNHFVMSEVFLSFIQGILVAVIPYKDNI
ncbi:MAG: thiamine diphosphokinase [Fidelibacterota bacterium]